ncbi:MAG: UvrD-helicase domain-containing protein [Ignavibacteria bacterium]
MKLTDEQKEIIKSEGNIKINAVAGSGKTTTIIEYAKARPENSKILYLAFNKSVKTEAIKKFAAKKLYNVKVETAHSLAYGHIVYGHGYRVSAKGYKSHEICEILHLSGVGEKHGEHIVANHISKFISYFCNSDKQKVSELNYTDVVSDNRANAFVSKHYDYIENQTRLFLSKMNSGEIEITHDFYLKKFQLSNPKLNYDYILFDEGQDASGAMLDVFLKQDAVKVIVGDTHQQIYGWRFAVNSLEKAEFKTFSLTNSFRFSQDIADLAMEVLKLKSQLASFKPSPIFGKNLSGETGSTAVIGRTNLGLLVNAIEIVTGKKKINSLYFEGNFNSYTYSEEGASLYDVLNLYNGKHKSIKDKLIKQMRSLSELQNYINKTGDSQLSMLVEIVKEYGNDIPQILKKIKELHVSDDKKEKADVIFSTVHRCKGMEYDAVQIVNDFINEEKLEKQKEELKKTGSGLSKINEEINLLYVAVTRTKNCIQIPETLLPKGFPDSPRIKKIIGEPVSGNKDNKNYSKIPYEKPDFSSTGKVYSVDKVREKFKSAYTPWTEKLDDELTVMYCEGAGIKKMAKHFGRTLNAVKMRIEKLELEDIYG